MKLWERDTLPITISGSSETPVHLQGKVPVETPDNAYLTHRTNRSSHRLSNPTSPVKQFHFCLVCL